jgi:hypothetical protein
MPLPPRLASDSREHAPLRRTLDKTEQGFAAVKRRTEKQGRKRGGIAAALEAGASRTMAVLAP